MTASTLRIFASSPSDVAAERARVKLVADRLNGELEGRVQLEVLRWEDAFYTAAHSFQEAIDAALDNMSATDMVLCIVWKRAGLKLNPGIWHRPDGSAYESGTVLEFETAVEVSRKHNGIPDVYLFRKTADVLLRADRASEGSSMRSCNRSGSAGPKAKRATTPRATRASPMSTISSASSKAVCGNGSSVAAWSREARSGTARSRALGSGGLQPSMRAMRRSSSAAKAPLRAPAQSCAGHRFSS